MLREVTRPDKSCVSFQYDTFGRRIEKSVTSIHSKGVSEGRQQKVIRFLWNGNNLFHEWEEKSTVGRRKTENKVDFKADYILKLEKREEEKAKKEAGQGENIPDNLITWVFQDDFIPRGKITKDGNDSIISDYLGTPVEAYDEEGKKVWKRNLDIYGRVKTEEALGEKNLIPFLTYQSSIYSLYSLLYIHKNTPLEISIITLFNNFNHNQISTYSSFL